MQKRTHLKGNSSLATADKSRTHYRQYQLHNKPCGVYQFIENAQVINFSSKRTSSVDLTTRWLMFICKSSINLDWPVVECHRNRVCVVPFALNPSSCASSFSLCMDFCKFHLVHVLRVFIGEPILLIIFQQIYRQYCIGCMVTSNCHLKIILVAFFFNHWFYRYFSHM